MTTIAELTRKAVLELDAKGLDPAAIARAVGHGITIDRVEHILDAHLYTPVIGSPEPERGTTAMAIQLEWAEPPAPSRRGSGRSDEIDGIVRALQSRPGQWAIVAKEQRTGSGHSVWRKRPGIEAVSRPIPGGEGKGKRWNIYARWVPAAKSA